jgi:hypothetical protein
LTPGRIVRMRDRDPPVFLMPHELRIGRARRRGLARAWLTRCRQP